jgi:hypothetical protein
VSACERSQRPGHHFKPKHMFSWTFQQCILYLGPSQHGVSDSIVLGAFFSHMHHPGLSSMEDDMCPRMSNDIRIGVSSVLQVSRSGYCIYLAK